MNVKTAHPILTFLRRVILVSGIILIAIGVHACSVGYATVMLALALLGSTLVLISISIGGSRFLVRTEVFIGIELFLLIVGFGSFYHFHSPTGNLIAAALIIPTIPYLMCFMIMKKPIEGWE